MRQKKLISMLIVGWVFFSLISMIDIITGTKVDTFDYTEFIVGDKVVYSYRTYSYQNPITGFAWGSTKYELYNITEISEANNEVIIKADFWDRDSLNDLTVGIPDEEDIVLGRLRIPPGIGNIIIPKNLKPEDYKNSYLAEIDSSINNPAITNTIQSYAGGQGLYIENKYGSDILGNHRILYATTGILLKESYEVSMGTTSDFISEKEIVPSRSTIAGADESYSESIISPWFFVFIIGVPGLILAVVISRKIMLNKKGLPIIPQEEVSLENSKSETIQKEIEPEIIQEKIKPEIKEEVIHQEIKEEISWKKAIKIESAPQNPKKPSIEEILEERRKKKGRKARNRTKKYWQLSILCFIVLVIINFAFVRIDSGSIEFGEGLHQRKSTYFHAPKNTQVILKTGGYYSQQNQIILYFGGPDQVNLQQVGTYSFNTGDQDFYSISVEGQSGTFRFSVHYASSYFVSQFFLISTGLWASVMTLLMLNSRRKPIKISPKEIHGRFDL